LLFLFSDHLLLIFFSIHSTVSHLLIIVVSLISISFINIYLSSLVPFLCHMSIPSEWPGTVDLLLSPLSKSLDIFAHLIVVYSLVVDIFIISGLSACKLVECLPIVQVFKCSKVSALTLLSRLCPPVRLSLSHVVVSLVALCCFDRDARIKYKLLESSLPAFGLIILLPSQTIHISLFDIIVCLNLSSLLLLLASAFGLLLSLIRVLRN
jgi:hypothetical protein